MKKVLIFAIAFMVIILPIKADEQRVPSANGDGAGLGPSSKEVSSSGKCQYGAGNYGPVGMRITVVDTNGNRVPGTRSLDFVQNTSYMYVGGGNLEYVSFNPHSTGYYRNASSGLMRNEVISSGVNPVLTTGSVGAYYWNKFPRNENNFGGALKTYFTTKFVSSDYNDMLSVFQNLGYDISDVENLKNHYLVVEPLIHMFWDSPIGNCQYERRYYYGTGTEVLAMLNQVQGEKVFLYRASDGRVYNRAVYSDIALSAYVPTVSVAGLMPATPFISRPGDIESEIMKDYGGKSYGLASIIIWLSDIIAPNTNPDTCAVTGFMSDPATDCSQSVSGYAADTNDWQCIFDQLGKSANTYEGQFYNPNGMTSEFSGTNPYCTVACREEVSYNFSGKFEVYAGSRFYIQTSNNFMENVTKVGPITMTGVAECRTGKNLDTKDNTINVAKFRTDYTNRNNEVYNTYYAWMEAKNRLAAYDSMRVSSTSNRENPCTEQHCSDYASYSVGLQGHADYNNVSCDNRENCSIKTECHTVSQDACSQFANGHRWYTERTWYSDRYGYSCSSTALGQNANVSKGSSSDGDSCSGLLNSLRNAENSARIAYEQAKSRREQSLNYIKSCNNFQRVYNEFDPYVSFVYSDSYYKKAYNLDRATSKVEAYTTYTTSNGGTSTRGWTTSDYGNVNEAFKKDYTNVYGSGTSIPTWICADGRCINNTTDVWYPTNTKVIQQTTKTYEYGLPDGVYRYVAKNGVSYNTADEARNSDYPFKDLGQSSLPIRYGTKPGSYDYYIDYYYNGTSENLFGRNQKFYQYNMVPSNGSTTYNGLTMSSNLSYKCTYDVVQHFLENNPGNNDLEVIYRTISLDNPFPGESGEGRLEGSNWIGNVIIFGDSMSYKDAYIKNNRGVSGEKVYQERPMFQFVLSASNIRAIRRYNKELKYNYNDFNLECEDGGYYCKSRFLQEGLGEGYFNFTNANSDGGTCFDASKDSWESCRYTSMGG